MLFDMEGRLHIKKHSKNADTGTLYTTNHPQLTTKKQTTEQHTLVQPPIKQNCQHQDWTPILCPSRQVFPERPQTQRNLQS